MEVSKTESVVAGCRTLKEISFTDYETFKTKKQFLFYLVLNSIKLNEVLFVFNKTKRYDTNILIEGLLVLSDIFNIKYENSPRTLSNILANYIETPYRNNYIWVDIECYFNNIPIKNNFIFFDNRNKEYTSLMHDYLSTYGERDILNNFKFIIKFDDIFKLR